MTGSSSPPAAAWMKGARPALGDDGRDRHPVFDPYRRERLPINDEEVIERAIALRDFLRIPENKRSF